MTSDPMRLHWLSGLFILSGLLLAACGVQEATVTSSVQVYIPPTSDLSTPASQRTDSENQPTPTPACVSGLRFLEDLTVPDETVVAPGEKIDKRWKVENTGSCNWDAEYQIQLIAGPALGAPSPQALFPALSGTEAVIRMAFTAPDEPGSYRSAWQAFDPDGRPFGDNFFIDIVVEAEE